MVESVGSERVRKAPRVTAVNCKGRESSRKWS